MEWAGQRFWLPLGEGGRTCRRSGRTALLVLASVHPLREWPLGQAALLIRAFYLCCVVPNVSTHCCSQLGNSTVEVLIALITLTGIYPKSHTDRAAPLASAKLWLYQVSQSNRENSPCDIGLTSQRTGPIIKAVAQNRGSQTDPSHAPSFCHFNRLTNPLRSLT